MQTPDWGEVQHLLFQHLQVSKECWWNIIVRMRGSIELNCQQTSSRSLLLTTCAHEAGHAAATKMHIHIVEQAYAIISTHLLIDCSINNFLSRYLHCDSADHFANVDPSSFRFQRNFITNAFPNQRWGPCRFVASLLAINSMRFGASDIERKLYSRLRAPDLMVVPFPCLFDEIKS